MYCGVWDRARERWSDVHVRETELLVNGAVGSPAGRHHTAGRTINLYDFRDLMCDLDLVCVFW